MLETELKKTRLPFEKSGCGSLHVTVDYRIVTGQNHSICFRGIRESNFARIGKSIKIGKQYSEFLYFRIIRNTHYIFNYNN